MVLKAPRFLPFLRLKIYALGADTHLQSITLKFLKYFGFFILSLFFNVNNFTKTSFFLIFWNDFFEKQK